MSTWDIYSRFQPTGKITRLWPGCSDRKEAEEQVLLYRFTFRHCHYWIRERTVLRGIASGRSGPAFGEV
jgi:hypothetical protein